MLAARLASSMIERIAYDEAQAVLSIWFRDTGRYVYSEVPRAIYEGLKKAPSAGRYFNLCIKRRFPCRPFRCRSFLGMVLTVPVRRPGVAPG